MCKKLTALFLCVFLFCGFSSAFAIPPAQEPTLRGMDVSVWQGDIDFSAVRESGIEVVYIRASYGADGVDRFLREHYEGARRAGLSVGFYHFLVAETTQEAVAQAVFFTDLIRDLPYQCRPVMDFEVFRQLPREQANRVARAFLDEVERRTGQLPMVYADAFNASRVFDERLSRFPLWVAEYGPEEPNVTANWTVWTGFQYTDAGRVPGVRGDVDLDRFAPGVFIDRPPEYLEYTVVRGDTLWAISRRYGTTVEVLVELNHIPDPDLIYVGQVLKIPR